MIKLTQKYNFKELYKNFKETKAEIAELRYDTHFIPHAIAHLGQNLTPRYDMHPETDTHLYSATKTLQTAPDDGTRELILLLAESPRGKILPKFKENSRAKATAKDYARYGALTPLLMYAMKEHHGTKYDEWDRQDPYIKYFLGSQLSCLLDFAGDFKSNDEDMNNSFLFNIPLGEIAGLRKQHLKVQSTGEVKAITDYKATPFEYLGVRIHGCPSAAIMLLQTWLANVEYRVPDAMILNPWFWDATPEPFDEYVKATSDGVKEATPWD